MWGQSKACTTVMNPEGAFATSIKSMGDTIHVHLRSVANDFGGSAGMFVNQMHSVVGDMNTSHIVNEGVERMLNELNTELGGMQSELSGMQYELQHMFDGVGSDIHQSMTGMDHTLSQIGPNVNQMISQNGNQMWSNAGHRMHMMQQGPQMQMHQSLSQIGPNVNRMVSHIGPNVNRGVRKGVNNMMQNFHQGFGQWRQNFGRSLNNMLCKYDKEVQCQIKVSIFVLYFSMKSSKIFLFLYGSFKLSQNYSCAIRSLY